MVKPKGTEPMKHFARITRQAVVLRRPILVSSLALAVGLNMCGCWSPLVIGTPMNESATVYGVHLHPLFGKADKAVGLDVSVLPADVSKGKDGPSVMDMKGVAVALVTSGVDRMDGLQVGLLGSAATVLRGVQIGGLFTWAEESNGLQLGLFNIADGWGGGKDSRCVQIGLINVCGDHWFPLVNINFHDSER